MDRRELHPIKMWLENPVEETDDENNRVGENNWDTLASIRPLLVAGVIERRSIGFGVASACAAAVISGSRAIASHLSLPGEPEPVVQV